MAVHPYPILSVVLLFFLNSCSGSFTSEKKSYKLPETATYKLVEEFEVQEAGEGNFFYMIKDIHFLNDGNIIVQNYPDQQLYEISPDGELVNTIGRKGRGPGEFMDIYETELMNDDSLHVIDLNYSRHQLMKKNSDGIWVAVREPAFKRRYPKDMAQQVPEYTFLTSGKHNVGVFRISPGMNDIDTLTRHYNYTARIDHNLRQVSKTNRLRTIQAEAKAEKGDQSLTFNYSRFFSAHYLYNPHQDEVIYITNSSNAITAIDSNGNESIKGHLPYDHFPIDPADIERYLDKLNSNPYLKYPFEELVKSKILNHEPYYYNIALSDDQQLWVHLAQSDTAKPNWVVTTLSGEILKSFHGPSNISSVQIHDGRMYGVKKSPKGAVSIVSYTLDTIP